MSHRTRFIPSGTPIPSSKASDTANPLDGTQSNDASAPSASSEEDSVSDKQRAEIFSSVPKLNLSSLKKKAAAAKNRQTHSAQRTHQSHQHRTLIIPPTVLEIDEIEIPDTAGNAAPKTASNTETVNISPKVSLRRVKSGQPMGMPAPDIQPPAYTSSYVPPPGFITHQVPDIPSMAHSQVSQAHTLYPAPSSAHTHPLTGRLQAHTHAQAEMPGSPHTGGYGTSGYFTPLRSSHSQTQTGRMGMYHNPNLSEGVFGRPPTPAPHSGDREREGEKRGSTVESVDEREREMEMYRGKAKRSRLHFGDVDMEGTHTPYSHMTHNQAPQSYEGQLHSHERGHVQLGSQPENQDADLSNSGINLDAYIAAHLEKFEEAKRKWADCSLEEWKAGADEITKIFSTLLDTVKSHLTSKLTLYTSLNTRCANQMKEIEENKKELGRVRKDMESGAGGVVGVGLLRGGGEGNNQRRSGNGGED